MKNHTEDGYYLSDGDIYTIKVNLTRLTGILDEINTKGYLSDKNKSQLVLLQKQITQIKVEE